MKLLDLDSQILIQLLKDKRRIWVLTGAGVSAPSGIPTYRNDAGEWKQSRPIEHDEFVNRPSSRQRYWARSLVGWKRIAEAEPNAAHHALTQLQDKGLMSALVTQNVDRLHSVAGTRDVIDLHGRLDRVICLDCGFEFDRSEFQDTLAAANPELARYSGEILPDGDARLENFDISRVSVPSCAVCGGTLMPDVVFFGGQIPEERVESAYGTLAQSDCILVLGSSLSVYSGYRFVKWSFENNLPVYGINQGDVRGTELFDHILRAPCQHILPDLVASL